MVKLYQSFFSRGRVICFSQLKTNEFPVPKWPAGRLPFPSTISSKLRHIKFHPIQDARTNFNGSKNITGFSSEFSNGMCHSCKGGVFGQTESLNPMTHLEGLKLISSALNGPSPQSCKSSSTPCASSLMVPGIGYLRLQKHLKETSEELDPQQVNK